MGLRRFAQDDNSAYTSRSALYCGVNVPAETGKMSRSDKRGATLPKVATVVSLLRNDVFFLPSLAGKVARVSVSDESRKGGIDL